MALRTWRRFLQWLRRAWEAADFPADVGMRALRIRNKRRWKRVLKTAIVVLWILIAPMSRLFAGAFRGAAAERVRARVSELWSTNPLDAVQVLRDVYEQLKINVPDNLLRSFDLPPFGRFTAFDLFQVEDHLFRCEMALGRYEEALTLCRSMPAISRSIVLQADCLVAMRKTDEAVALLRSNLHLDQLDDQIHDKLASLTGKADAGPN
jgi:hypothetical protein